MPLTVSCLSDGGIWKPHKKRDGIAAECLPAYATPGHQPERRV